MKLFDNHFGGAWRSLFAGAAISTALAIGTSTVALGAEFTMNFSAPHSAGYPSVDAAQYFADELAKRSDGRIEVKIFPAGQLGGAQATFDGLRQGTIQSGYTAAAWVASAVPKASAFSLAYLFKDSAAAYRAMDGEAGAQIGKELEDVAGVKILGWLDAGFNQFLNNRHPIIAIDDLSGLKFRVINNPIYIATFQAWGANPIGMDFTEVFTSLQQGAIDGLELPNAATVSTKFHEALNYASISNHVFTPEVMMINKAYFDRLPPDLQELVVTMGEEATAKQRELAADADAKALEAMKDAGVEVNIVGPETIADLAAAMDPVYELAGERFGADFVAEVQAEAAKDN